jgi:MYXO-CTERM domain-containing protein
MKKVALALAVAIALSVPVLAHAAETDPSDCPPGSVNKTENGMTWCEPSVCETDGQCLPSEVCRPMALCVQIGTVAGDASATANNKSSRLIATGRCAADKKCPNTTTCSEKSRCIEKQKADKMGLLTVPAPSSSSTPTDGPKKSGCGCGVVGDASGGSAPVGGAVSVVGLGLVVVRRSRRARQLR